MELLPFILLSCISICNAFIQNLQPEIFKIQKISEHHNYSKRGSSALWGKKGRRLSKAVDGAELIEDYKPGELYDTTDSDAAKIQSATTKVIGDVFEFRDEYVTQPADVLMYSKYTEFDMSDKVFQSVMDTYGTTVICTGEGKEIYYDPGETTIYRVDYAPVKAAESCLSTLTSVPDLKDAILLVVNVCGGSELQIQEVKEGIKIVVGGLNIPDDLRIKFNSVCHTDFSSEIASMTVIAKFNDDDIEVSGVEKCLANGEAYFYRGKWLTCLDEDLQSFSDVFTDSYYTDNDEDYEDEDDDDE